MRVLGLADTPTATAVMIAFVLLGDFRIYLLIFTLMSQPARARRAGRRSVLATRDAIRLVPPRAALAAALATLVVPLVTVAIDGALAPASRLFRGSRSGSSTSSPSWSWRSCSVRSWSETGPGTAPRLRYLPPPRARVRHRLLRALGDGRRAHPRRHRPRLGAPHDSNQLYYAFSVPFAYFSFFHAALESNLFDAGGMVEGPVGKGSFALAARGSPTVPVGAWSRRLG